VGDTARRIGPIELDRLVRSGNVTILDMRRDWDQADTKIPGAIRVHPDAYRDYAGALPKDRPVVTYCT
jgi:rhodanese-related sulfurtransferase